MDRLKAVGLHFSISVIICLPVFYLIYYVWYPSPLLFIQGGENIFLLLVISTIFLGPLLSFIVFKPGKKFLIFDFIVITLVQITALLYGSYILYLERPIYIAFNVDRFSLITINSININKLQDKSLSISQLEKAKLVYVEIPNDETKRMEVTLKAMSGGKDFVQHPEFYHPYQNFFSIVQVNRYLLSATNLMQIYPELTNKLKLIAKEYQLNTQELLLYPLEGKNSDALIVLEKNNPQYLRIINNINPWDIMKRNDK